MANSDLPVPQGVIAGKYRLTCLLGRGGMGAVWEGTHISLGTRVAVKFIDAGYAESPEARSRFENEARAAARLRSKHVVEVYDHGVSEDGRPFIVMEFLQGEPLDKRLDRVLRLPARETAQIVLQVCRALTKAHAANIVHRDLKPENIFLVRDEEEGTDVVKVVDFGIAKFNDASLGTSSATRTGSLLGTPHYMSPEQARGLRSVDSRSDLWSVAVIAYRCIVGELPFEGEAVGDLLVNLCTGPIPVPSLLAPDIPPGFDAWLEKALNRDPEQRFATAAQFADSLALVCGLPARSQFTSGEMQRMPDGGSGAYPAVSNGERQSLTSQRRSLTASEAQTVALPTGAPTTQTPVPKKRAGPGARVVAALGIVAVLGGGSIVALKFLGSSPPVTGGRPSTAPVAEVARTAQTPARPKEPEPVLPPVPSAVMTADVIAPPPNSALPAIKPGLAPKLPGRPPKPAAAHRPVDKPTTPNMGF